VKNIVCGEKDSDVDHLQLRVICGNNHTGHATPYLDGNKVAFVCTVTFRDLLTQNFQIVVRVPPVVRQPPVVLTDIFPVAALAATVGFRWPFTGR
jgi:hypothetical protein